MRRIDANKLKKLVEGSYEHKIYLITETLNKKLNNALNIPLKCNILATFDGHGVALAEDNTLFKFAYTIDQDGNIESVINEII